MQKNTKGFCSLLNWMPNSIASINPIAESWLPYNAQLTARSNVGDFTAYLCRKGANITESGGAACYTIFALHSFNTTLLVLHYTP